MTLLKSRTRLRSVKSLNSILAAMQVVTVVRMQKIKAVFANTQDYLKPAQALLKGELPGKKLKNKVLLVITSNRGLCGSFNAQVIGKARDFLTQEERFSVVTLGRRGADYFRRRGKLLFTDADVLEKPNLAKSAAVWQRLLALEAEIYVAYNLYESTVKQLPTIYKLYPVPEELTGQGERANFIFEPDKNEFMAKMTEHYFVARFHQLIIASQMGELAARILVLKSAVDNSKDLIDDLTVAINKMRQTSITRDLSEIIGSVEALREEK